MAKGSPVFRNALILVGAQLVGTPLTIIINAVMGRYLGPEAFGYVYLANTLTRLGFLFVAWGHGGVLPAAVARDRSRAGALLGSAIAWRLSTSVVISAALAAGCWALGYSGAFQLVLALVCVQCMFGVVSASCQDTVKGFERTDVTGYAQVGSQILLAAVVIPTLVVGGQLTSVLLAQIAVAAIVLPFVWRATMRAGVTNVTVRRTDLNELFRMGSYFLFFDIAMALQANIDVVLLSKLAPPEVVGWQAAAQRLGGVLLVPASALVAALYPTLARLFVEDRAGYVDTVRKAIYGTTVLAVPVALGCAFYRDVGVQLFSREAFGPVRQNLLVISALLPLVYVSMPLGTAIFAAGRHRAWAAVQTLCVVVSAGLDPLLIPWFQKHYGNGGLGVCVAGVTSEVLMVTGGCFLTAPGVIDRRLGKGVAKATIAGAVMAGVAYLLAPITPFVAAPIAALAYAGALWLVRGIDPELVAAVRNTIMRRFRR